jgi:3-deoxy-D-manno-octulosonate 8-phosphate phosphatase (KDO 8-P phosphatase)
MDSEKFENGYPWLQGNELLKESMVNEKAARIKLLVLDVDGVLTDGRIIISDSGEETKAFHVRDGQGLKLLMKAGVGVMIITGRRSNVVSIRAGELGIQAVHQGVKDKLRVFEEGLEERGLAGEHACVVGDDLADLPLLNHCGLPVAVADAAEEVRNAAVVVTENTGGRGAVREVCEMILKAKGEWPRLLKTFQDLRK